jgi:hypothetical protein
MAKQYGIKNKVSLGTYWELDGNTFGKPPPLPPLTKTQKKKTKPLNLLIGCMKFIFLKWYVTIFNLD